MQRVDWHAHGTADVNDLEVTAADELVHRRAPDPKKLGGFSDRQQHRRNVFHTDE
jgi:hypothetical protein